MVVAGATMYGIVAVLFGALFLLLLPSANKQPISLAFLMGCAVSLAWSLLLALQIAAPDRVPAPAVFALEALRAAAWLSFLMLFLRTIGDRKKPWSFIHLTWLAMLGLSISWWFGAEYASEVATVPKLVLPLGLGIGLCGLLMVEQIYRNTPRQYRWKVNALCLSFGGVFAFDVFLYAQAMLFGGLDPIVWLSRGAINAFFVPFLAIAARRNSQWDLSIFVSRQVVFYSSTLFAVGAYLMLMGLGGYLLQYYAGEVGQVLRIAFLAISALVLVALLLSEPIRAKIRVFINKHFYRNKYDYRDEWLKLIASLEESESDSAVEATLPALARILDCPAGTLWLLDDESNRYAVSSVWNMTAPIDTIGVDDPLATFMSRSSWLVDVREYQKRPDIYGNLKLPDWLSECEDAWLLLPLVFRNEVCGIALLQRSTTAADLNFEDRDLLKTVANHLAVHVVQEKADQQLVEIKQFAAFNRLTAFLMHDLKNLVSQLSLIVQNADRHRDNPEFIEDSFSTIAGAVTRMEKVIARLKQGRSQGTSREHELRFLVSSAVDRCVGSRPVPTLESGGGDARVRVSEHDLIMVLVHLIKNGQDATPDDGQINVRVKPGDVNVVIEIEDSGCGMSAGFVRERLFKPFESTKGVEGMGIGAYQARQFARSQGGDVNVESRPGSGTLVRMRLPLAN